MWTDKCPHFDSPKATSYFVRKKRLDLVDAKPRQVFSVFDASCNKRSWRLPSGVIVSSMPRLRRRLRLPASCLLPLRCRIHQICFIFWPNHLRSRVYFSLSHLEPHMHLTILTFTIANFVRGEVSMRFIRLGHARTTSDVVSDILNWICPECGGRMGGRGKEFKCQGECQKDWRLIWENLLSLARRASVSGSSRRSQAPA